jgi:iodotyrosine deiodinase
VSDYKPIPLDFESLTPEEMLLRSRQFCQRLSKRRTVREFSNRNIEEEILINAIRAAGSSPSGANKQPWHFVLVSDPDVKKEIRLAAEKEEREFYTRRAPQSWLEDLQQFGTDADKPFLEQAPYLIAIFLQKFSLDSESNKHKNYYMPESLGIATGLLITALHWSGLATLTHTPSPMAFLNSILKRPKNEKPFLLLVVGYPDDNAQVPEIERKQLTDILTRF